MNLTEAQQQAIEVAAPALQIVACAGSGKTEVLARRVVRRMLDGVPPGAIVAFTFTEKAAAELKERIEQRAAQADPRFAVLPPASAGLFVGTIHSWCLQNLQRCGGIYELFDPLPREREWTVLHRFGRRLGLVDLMTGTWPGQHVSVRRAVELFSRSLAVVQDEGIGQEVLHDRTPALAQAISRYAELLNGMQLLPFDQMIALACQELAAGGSIRQSAEGRLKEVFVDEYQDLNKAQEEVLRHLVSLGARLTVVGDDDQAIYQWRGGDVSIFLHFESRFSGTERQLLAENHRSVEPIVAVSRCFVGLVQERFDKPFLARRKSKGPAIELLPAETPEQEAELLAKRIRVLLRSGHKPRDIAVLYRSVRSSAKPLLDALRRSAVPAAAVGRLSLLDRPETALLARLFVFWAGGTWQPDEDREVVTAERLAQDLAELTGKSEVEATRVVSRLEQMGQQLTSEGVPDLISVYTDVLDLVGLPTSGPERPRQERGLGQFSSLLTEFEHGQRRAAPAEWFAPSTPTAAEEASEDKALADLREREEKAHIKLGFSPGELYLARLRVFLEEFASAAIEESPDSPTLDRDAVNVMTIHQAKGLEFPIVFLPALVERRFPSAKMGRAQLWYVPDDLFDKARYEGREDDERRLFYVALTRAREMLVLSWFARYASGTAANRSRFIDEMVKVAPHEHFSQPGQCRPPTDAKTAAERTTLLTSFGELYTYHECPRKYYLRCLCEFQPPLAPELGFGKLLHHALAELARCVLRGRLPTVDDLDEILPSQCYLPFASRTMRERLYKSAHRRLRNYLRKHGKELERTIAPERQFEVPINSARVVGRIDLLLQAEGGGAADVELVDFKTAANRPPAEHHQGQLRLYAHAARLLGMNPVRLVIHDLDADTGGRITVEHNEAEEARFRRQVQDWLKSIAEGRFSRVRRHGKCGSCDFAKLCR